MTLRKTQQLGTGIVGNKGAFSFHVVIAGESGDDGRLKEIAAQTGGEFSEKGHFVSVPVMGTSENSVGDRPSSSEIEAAMAALTTNLKDFQIQWGR